jgi:hypothetical protein
VTTTEEAIRTALAATGIKPVSVTRDANQYPGKMSKNAYTLTCRTADDAHSLDEFLGALHGIYSRANGTTVHVHQDKRPSYRR